MPAQSQGVVLRLMGGCCGVITRKYTGKFKDTANYSACYEEAGSRGFHLFEAQTYVSAESAPTAPDNSWIVIKRIE